MTKPAIEVHDLRKRFGSVVALDGIDLEVPSGTVFGLLGPNGAGKTTTVRILTTTTRPDSGDARVLGVDVASHPGIVRENIGLAGQFAAVDENLTARENLKMIGRLTHLSSPLIAERSNELLERFDLVGAADRPVRTYSGGMRRRLDLSAALLHHPPVLFLDEPTTGLDPHSRADMWRVIEELVEDGTTVLLTTQYLEEADRLADRIAVIDQGKVIAEGTASELKARLGSTVIDLGLGDVATAMRAHTILVRVSLGRTEHDGASVRITVDDAPPAVLRALRELDGEGLAPTAISVREPSLDDVFLTLTGRPVETDQPDEISTRGAA